jgi:hypothetical protein
MNAAGHPTRYRPEYREPGDDCCLPGASGLELAKFFAVAPRAVDNSIAILGAHRARQHHPWCFARLPPLYTGAKELSYPACRRLGLGKQAQGRVVKLPTRAASGRRICRMGKPARVLPRSARRLGDVEAGLS